jgi:hypothetical protein
MNNVYSHLLDLDTDSGNIDISNFFGTQDTTNERSFTIKSSKGNINIDTLLISEDLKVRTIQGNIHTRNIIFRENETADIPPQLSLETYKGNVIVQNYNGFILRGNVAYSGSVQLEVDKHFLGEFDLKVITSGTVTVNDTVVRDQIEYYVEEKFEKKGIVSQKDVHQIQIIEFFANSGTIDLTFKN